MIIPERKRIEDVIDTVTDMALVSDAEGPTVTVNKRDIYTLLTCARLVLNNAVLHQTNAIDAPTGRFSP